MAEELASLRAKLARLEEALEDANSKKMEAAEVIFILFYERPYARTIFCQRKLVRKVTFYLNFQFCNTRIPPPPDFEENF